jgi:preprotein translocase subunit SecG
MYTLAVIIHLIVCFLMIASILLQAGKGAEIGAAFGGSSQTVFGSRGPGTFLSKVTVGAAIIFMLTSLSLALLSKKGTTASTVIDLETPIQQSTPTTQGSTPSPEPTKASSESTEPSTESTPASPAKTPATSEP